MRAMPANSRPPDPVVGEGGVEAICPPELPPESLSWCGRNPPLGEIRPPSPEEWLTRLACMAPEPCTGHVGEMVVGMGLGGGWCVGLCRGYCGWWWWKGWRDECAADMLRDESARGREVGFSWGERWVALHRAAS